MVWLTVQTYLDGCWHDACELHFEEPDVGRYGKVLLEYDAGYVARFQGNPAAQVSARFPLDFFPHQTDQWPAFLLDIMPLGAARRYWGQHLNLPEIQHPKYDFQLLKEATRAPIGNLRIKESAPESELPVIGFPMDQVLEQATEFLDYARSQGAAVGGATGAGGDAPKYQLIRGDDNLFYPDAALPDNQALEYLLIKFPRRSSAQGRALASDRIILETEHAYYELAKRLGVDSVQATLHIEDRLLSEDTVSSLWMPRFDREVGGKQVKRLAVESLYSLTGVIEAGASIDHTVYLRELTGLWRKYDQANDIECMVQEYLRRDLFNVLLGNSDNHGRNTSIMRCESGVTLSPIYDLAPMVLDESGITRTSRWHRKNELGGEFQWRGICEEAAEASATDGMKLWSGLRDFALTLQDAPRYAEESGVPEAVLNIKRHALNLRGIPECLKHWGLI